MNKKKLLGVPFAVVAALLVVASAAYACTVFAGTFTVRGEVPGSGSVTATGQPTGCRYLLGQNNQLLERPTGGMDQTVSGSYGDAQTEQGAGTVTVSTGPAGTIQGTTCTNKLPAGPYDINWYSGKGYKPHNTWVRDCMSPLMGLGVKVGEVVVGTDGRLVDPDGTNPVNGTGEVTFPITSPFKNQGTNEEGAVCISDAIGGYGNQAPMLVIGLSIP